MTEQEKFFVSEAMRHARSLRLCDAIAFLEGMLATLSDQHPARPRLVAARNHFTQADAQLDLIAVGQLKMEELLQS